LSWCFPVAGTASTSAWCRRISLRAKTGAAQANVQRNRVTAGRLQLRLGRDLRWYPYARTDGGWEPSGTPEADPARALTDL